jgi:hypothetical protein
MGKNARHKRKPKKLLLPSHWQIVTIMALMFVLLLTVAYSQKNQIYVQNAAQPVEPSFVDLDHPSVPPSAVQLQGTETLTGNPGTTINPANPAVSAAPCSGTASVRYYGGTEQARRHRGYSGGGGNNGGSGNGGGNFLQELLSFLEQLLSYIEKLLGISGGTPLPGIPTAPSAAPNQTPCNPTPGISGSAPATSGTPSTQPVTSVTSAQPVTSITSTQPSAGSTIQPSATPPSTTSVVPQGISGTWKLIFDDEFNGTSLDTSKWAPYWFSNGNTQNNTTMETSNISVSGGYLNLIDTGGTGAIVSTNPSAGGNFQFTYGAVEARIYLPASGSQVANWPAWWTDRQNWPTDGEMDVMEGLGGSACYHFHDPSGGPGGCANGNFSGWHTFGANWQAGSVTYYYDGKQVGTINSGITSSPMFLILENSSGSPSVTPSTMKVDYVRVWQ